MKECQILDQSSVSPVCRTLIDFIKRLEESKCPSDHFMIFFIIMNVHESGVSHHEAPLLEHLDLSWSIQENHRGVLIVSFSPWTHCEIIIHFICPSMFLLILK